MELRQRCHQEWLLNILQERIDETGFHGLIFLREGLRFTWAKLEGMNKGRFNRIKEGAASKYGIAYPVFLALWAKRCLESTEFRKIFGQLKGC